MEIVRYPGRSPLIVTDVLQPLIQDKIVCDIGCAAGDLMLAFRFYAKEVIGVEWTPNRFPEKVDKDLNIIYADALADDFTIPKADVYYIWVVPNELRGLINKIESGTIILGDYGDNPAIKEDLGGHTIKIPFTEGDKTGWWRLTIIQK